MSFYFSYRRVYPWVFIPVILGVVLCFVFDIHKSEGSVIINSLKIISSAIGILGFTVSLVEVGMNKNISKIASKAAKEAEAGVKKAVQLMNDARADFRIEIIRGCIESGDYTRGNDQIKEVKKVIGNYKTNNRNDQAKFYMEKIENLQTQFSLASKSNKLLDDHDLRKAFDLLSKIDTFINDKIEL